MNKISTALIITSFVLFFVAIFVFARSDTKKANKLAETMYENISPADLQSILNNKKDIFLLDVHTPEQTHIDGTDAFIPFDQITENEDKLPADRSTEIVVYCRSGNMSEYASKKLYELGYKNVKNLVGGKNAWEEFKNEQ